MEAHKEAHNRFVDAMPGFKLENHSCDGCTMSFKSKEELEMHNNHECLSFNHNGEINEVIGNAVLLSTHMVRVNKQSFPIDWRTNQCFQSISKGRNPMIYFVIGTNWYGFFAKIGMTTLDVFTRFGLFPIAYAKSYEVVWSDKPPPPWFIHHLASLFLGYTKDFSRAYCMAMGKDSYDSYTKYLLTLFMEQLMLSRYQAVYPRQVKDPEQLLKKGGSTEVIQYVQCDQETSFKDKQDALSRLLQDSLIKVYEIESGAFEFEVGGSNIKLQLVSDPNPRITTHRTNEYGKSSKVIKTLNRIQHMGKECGPLTTFKLDATSLKPNGDDKFNDVFDDAAELDFGDNDVQANYINRDTPSKKQKSNTYNTSSSTKGNTTSYNTGSYNTRSRAMNDMTLVQLGRD